MSFTIYVNKVEKNKLNDFGNILPKINWYYREQKGNITNVKLRVYKRTK